ncbi:MAG: hypothetical protein EHM42_05600, partial [Planctomycetaceae bacterium]
MAASSNIAVLVLGDLGCPDLLPVISWLRGKIIHGRLREAHRVADAIRLYPPGSSPPDLIVACQSWPDEFSAADVHALIAWQPLAQLVCCFGPWCDSDGRTRDAWPLAVRVPANESVRILEDAVRTSPAAAPSSPDGRDRWPRSPLANRRLPLTASRNELFASRFPAAETHVAWARQTLLGQTVDVESPDRAWREMMSRFLRRCGANSNGRDNVRSLQRPQPALVWDADPAEPGRIAALIEQRSA